MSRPQVLTPEELEAELAGAGDGAALWTLERFRARAEERFGLSSVDSLDELADGVHTLLVIGGGAKIDEAKLWRRHARPALRLVAVPSLWGSGAEASRVVALNRADGKLIEVDDELLPHARSTWPDLARDLPDWRAREACGDAWSHALEGFLSPLGTEELRAEIAVLLNTMLELPLGNDPRWFEVSARACAAQARASVGLVHGIAHVIERPLTGTEVGGHGFGHARLCSLYLAPVVALNRALSPKFDDFTQAQGVDGAAVLAVLDELFEAEAYAATLGPLEEHWRSVLRDPCSRTNSALVRPQHLAHFTDWSAS